jgi:hypothetical protein
MASRKARPRRGELPVDPLRRFAKPVIPVQEQLVIRADAGLPALKFIERSMKTDEPSCARSIRDNRFKSIDSVWQAGGATPREMGLRLYIPPKRTVLRFSGSSQNIGCLSGVSCGTLEVPEPERQRRFDFIGRIARTSRLSCCSPWSPPRCGLVLLIYAFPECADRGGRCLWVLTLQDQRLSNHSGNIRIERGKDIRLGKGSGEARVESEVERAIRWVSIGSPESLSYALSNTVAHERGIAKVGDYEPLKLAASGGNTRQHN